MKRVFLLVVGVLMTVAAAAQMRETYPSYISVNGYAEREVTPDEFYLSIVLDERDSKGKILVENQRRDMVAELKRLGVDVEKQLKVANLSSEFFKKKSSVAQAKYQLKLGSAAEVAKVWQALDALNISNVSIQKVTHSKLAQFKNEIRIEAIRNARENARMLAAAIDQQVGPCFYIYDSNSDALPRFNAEMYCLVSTRAKNAADVAEAAEEEVVEFKTIKLEYNVQTKFVLEPR
ncbi:MAG: SIMPL domain-containing protein [Alistipes senegalensis]|nr:SIMPL domain-containing protein [Bacteroides cellulosilyticus]MCM1351396.1 SIMPL domain-containing protein [Alistipes senegalensis]